MFQTFAFSSGAYQYNGIAVNDNTGKGYNTSYSNYSVLKRQQEIRKEKTELQKVESVIAENKRLADLAARNKLEASKKAALRLAQLEAEYLAEINRLMQVRAMLLQRIKQNEDALIALLMLKRRRIA